MTTTIENGKPKASYVWVEVTRTTTVRIPVKLPEGSTGLPGVVAIGKLRSETSTPQLNAKLDRDGATTISFATL